MTQLKKLQAVGLAGLALLASACAGLKPVPVAPWTGDFDQTPWAAAFHCEWGPAHGERSQVVSDPGLGRKALRVLYPAHGLGPEGGGTQFLTRFGHKGHPLRDDAEHLFIRYWLYFEPGFDFSKGGKLPGLAGNTRPGTSPKTGGGGEPKDDSEGFSARIMWREEGKAFQYVYHPGQSGAYGDYYPWIKDGQPVHFRVGRWHCVETEVQLNRPGAKDAVLRSWLDGDLVLDKTHLALRREDDLRINCFFFDTFFGGGEPDWAPKTDSYIRFGPVQVAGSRAGLEPLREP